MILKGKDEKMKTDLTLLIEMKLEQIKSSKFKLKNQWIEEFMIFSNIKNESTNA